MRLALANFTVTFASSPTLPQLISCFLSRTTCSNRNNMRPSITFGMCKNTANLLRLLVLFGMLLPRYLRDFGEVFTLKLRCILAERLNRCQSNCITGIDSIDCDYWERMVHQLRHIVVITVGG
ncbi:hypothetical protein PR003_g1447 [Phytophthora rubi]|uniref:Uncharacterized protein n=1 Tax=Phytophthora rubi TaxID=129364 RepID=A0A6A3P5H1_9STRA|nr:hypothetical protein PR002_g262 [Phytophthora rubi]KAE9052250.1 hypothetical protein PR001_g708 [Phytophthora rubi]KAE9358124.1 hypothetical protein PR003_g1447 [Phytophthora rubi]